MANELVQFDDEGLQNTEPQGGKRRRRPRKKKLDDPQVVGRFLRAIQVGASFKDAADYAGVNVKTVARMRALNVHFVDMIRGALAIGKVELLDLLHRKAMEGDVGTAKWKLSRRWPSEWGNRQPDVVPPNELQQILNALGAALMQEFPGEIGQRIAEKFEQIIAAVAKAEGED